MHGMDLEIVDNPDAHRFEAREDGKVVGFSVYRRIGQTVIFMHTEVDPAYEGRGIGSRLVRQALDAVRGDGLRVRAECPFVAAYLRRHPEFEDLLAG